MRITYIHQYFTTRSMPGGTRSYEQARRLVERGHEVDVLTTDREASDARSPTWRVTMEDGIRVHWLPVPYSNAMTPPQRVRAFLRFAVLASVRATGLRGDVVFATSTPLTVAIPGVLAARLRRTRFVFEVRDLWPELPVEVGALRHPLAIRLADGLARTAYRNAAHVVALSDGMADGVAAHGYPRERISVVPNAADLDLFADAEEAGRRFRLARPWLGQRPLVVYVGALGPINGVGYLVRLAARTALLDPEIRFLVVGDGAERSCVETLARDLGVLGVNLFLAAPVPKRDVPAILGAATMATSLFLPLPGMAANSANKFFDALAAARPIAVNYGGWQADLLAETGAGLVLDPSDVTAAATALVTRIRDPAWLARAGRAAYGLAVDRFSRDRLYEVFEAALLGHDTVGAAAP